MECEGHRNGEYLSYEAFLQRQEEEKLRTEALIQKKAEEARVKAEIREQNRWFRKHLDDLDVGIPLWVQNLPSEYLKGFFSFVGELSHYFHKGPYLKLALPVIAELKARGIDWPVGAYELKLSPGPLSFDFGPLGDIEVQGWEVVFSHVCDYSILNSGVRQLVTFLDSRFRKEIERRGLKRLDFVY